MTRTDILFNYNNTTRFVLLHKLSVLNSFLVPSLHKLVCYFSVKNIEDLNDVKIYNYFFFLKFFFGTRAFFTGYRMDQGFGRTAYDFNIQIVIRKTDLSFPFSFILNDVMPIIDNDYLYYNLKKIDYFICNVTIKDMNIFSEKKTNLGLFNLKDNFNLKFYISAKSMVHAKLYFNNSKLYFIK